MFSETEVTAGELLEIKAGRIYQLRSCEDTELLEITISSLIEDENILLKGD